MRTHARPPSNLPLTLIGVPLLIFVGCGGESDDLPREAVSGTVTLDGRPLDDGVIQLLPASRQEGTAGGAVVRDGKFAIERGKGVVPGTYRVVISSSLSRGEPAGAGGAPGPVVPADKPKDLIPPQYNVKSTLKADVKAGSANTFEFPLKSH